MIKSQGGAPARKSHPGYVAGRYYVPSGQGLGIVGATLTVGTTYLSFGSIEERITVSQLGARVATVSAGGNFQLAVYAHDAATGMPGKLVASTGSGSTAATGIVNNALAANATIEPGFYWFALQSDNSTAVFMVAGSNSFAFLSLIGSGTGAINGSGTSQAAAVTTPGTFGTWPADLTGAPFTEFQARGPLLQFLVASVP